MSSFSSFGFLVYRRRPVESGHSEVDVWQRSMVERRFHFSLPVQSELPSWLELDSGQHQYVMTGRRVALRDLDLPKLGPDCGSALLPDLDLDCPKLLDLDFGSLRGLDFGWPWHSGRKLEPHHQSEAEFVDWTFEL